MNARLLGPPPKTENEPVLFADKLGPSEEDFNLQMRAHIKPTQRLFYDMNQTALINFGLILVKEDCPQKEERYLQERDCLGINPLHVLSWNTLCRKTTPYGMNKEGILCYESKVLPALDQYYTIILRTIRGMRQNPTEDEVVEQVLKEYQIPRNVLTLFFDISAPAQGVKALVPAQHCRGGGRVVHPSGGSGSEPMVHGNPDGDHVMADGILTTLVMDSIKEGKIQNLYVGATIYNAAETIHSSGSGGNGGNGGGATKEEIQSIMRSAGVELMHKMDSSHQELSHMLSHKMETGIQDVKATVTLGIEESAVKAAQSAVKAVPSSSQKARLFGSPLGASFQMLQESPSPDAHARVILPGTTCTESAKDLRWLAENADLCHKDGIEYPPEQRLSLENIRTEYGTVEALVQLTCNKFIRVGDAGFILLDAGPLNGVSIEDATDQNATMLPSAGYSTSFDINITMTSQAREMEREVVSFSVCAKTVNDRVCHGIIALLVRIALKDGTVGQVSLEGPSSEEHPVLSQVFELEFLSSLHRDAAGRKGPAPTFKLERFWIPSKFFNVMTQMTRAEEVRFAYTNCNELLDNSNRTVRIEDTTRDWADNFEDPQGFGPAMLSSTGLTVELDPFIDSTPDANKAKPAALDFYAFVSQVPADGPKASDDAPPASNNNSTQQQQEPVASIWSQDVGSKKRCTVCTTHNDANATKCCACGENHFVPMGVPASGSIERGALVNPTAGSTGGSDNGHQRVSRRKLGLAPEHGLLN